MGCDIHMFAERKVKFTSSLQDNHKTEFWLKIGKIFKNYYFDPLQPLGDINEILVDTPYADRNYNLFAFLAGVRNEDNIKPLAKPRGLPKDVSDEIKKESDEWGIDGHSHSYFTLEELIKVDWKKTYVKQSGLVDPENYKIFKKTGRPSEWCSMTTADNYKEVSWCVSLLECCESFVYESLLRLRSYSIREKIPINDIRIVFWFDN